MIKIKNWLKFSGITTTQRIRSILLGLFFFVPGFFAQEKLVHPGEFIEVSGVLRDILGDYYVSTPDGVHFLVLGDFDAVMKATLEPDAYSDIAEELSYDLRRGDGTLDVVLTGYYTVLLDTEDQVIHVLVAGKGEEWKDFSLTLTNPGPSEIPSGEFFLLEPPEYSWHWTLPELREPAADFMLKYLTYSRKLERDTQRFIDQWLQEAGAEGNELFSIYLRFAKWKAFMANAPLYYSWRRSLDRYRKILVKEVKEKIDPSSIYLRIVKRDYMIYAVEKGTERLVFAFPMSYGLNPDSASKEEEDDWRTPDTPEEYRTPENTPMRIGRRLGYSVRPGMITRNLGIESNRPEDKFWSKWGMNVVIHGSPNFASIGTRASHGCIRMLPVDVKELFEITQKGTPVIIQ
jgi:hypothetical protein